MQPKCIQPDLLWITWHSFLVALSHLSNRDQWGAELTEWEMCFRMKICLEQSGLCPNSYRGTSSSRNTIPEYPLQGNEHFSCASFCSRVIPITRGKRIGVIHLYGSLISPYSCYFRKVLIEPCLFLNSHTIDCHININTYLLPSLVSKTIKKLSKVTTVELDDNI